MQPPKRKALKKIRDRTVPEIMALKDTLQRVLSTGPIEELMGLQSASLGGQALYERGKNPTVQVNLDMDGRTLAHEMTHVGQGGSLGNWPWRAMNKVGEDLPRSEQIRSKQFSDLNSRAYDAIPDTARTTAGLTFDEAGGGGEKLPHVVERTYEALANADGAPWYDLDAERDSVAKMAKETPLLQDMMHMFVSHPDYKRMEWLTKPKLPKAGVVDAVRRR